MARGRAPRRDEGRAGERGQGGGVALFVEAAVAVVRVEPAATALRCLARGAVRLEDERCAARRQEPLLVRVWGRVRSGSVDRVRVRVSGRGQWSGSGLGSVVRVSDQGQG